MMDTNFLSSGTSLIKTSSNVEDVYEMLSRELKMKTHSIFMLGFCIGYHSGQKCEHLELKGKEFRSSYLSEKQQGILYAVGINEGILDEDSASYTDPQKQQALRKLWLEYSASGLLQLKAKFEENGKVLGDQKKIDLLSGILQYFIDSKEEIPF